MKNFEKHADKIANSLWRYNYGVKNGEIPCDILNGILFDESWSGGKIKSWLMEEAEEEKIKVSKAEYDILCSLVKTFKAHKSLKSIIQSDSIINYLVNECGWFKNLDKKIDDSIVYILNNVEVAETTSTLTYNKNSDISFEGEN